MTTTASTTMFKSSLNSEQNENFIEKIEDKNKLNEYINNNMICVLDFCAPWCNPCNKLSPYLHELSTKYTEVCFIKIDVDIHSNISELYNITSLPTVLILYYGKQFDLITGYNTKTVETITQKIDYLQKENTTGGNTHDNPELTNI